MDKEKILSDFSNKISDEIEKAFNSGLTINEIVGSVYLNLFTFLFTITSEIVKDVGKKDESEIDKHHKYFG